MDIEVGTNKVYYFTVSEKKEKLAQNPPVSVAYFVDTHLPSLFSRATAARVLTRKQATAGW